ncbi:MAG TPA: hypothetical protein VK890_01325 [Bacteroidia bacterium]|jgi:hypothetical protein|nr:hypothetical protein [Bacteroidia bacterium]
MKYLIPLLIIVLLSGCTSFFNNDKKDIDINNVSRIDISKAKDSAHVLSEQQEKEFIDKWNNAPGEGPCIYIAHYLITVHLKDSSIRNFRANGQAIKESSDYGYLFGDTAYFRKLWEAQRK